MRDKSFAPILVVAVVMIVLLVGVAMRSSVSSPAVAAPDAPRSDARLATLQVSPAPGGGLIVYDTETGDVFSVPLPYNEKSPMTQVGTLRRKDGGKWDFAPPPGAAGNDNAKAEATRLATAKTDIAEIGLALRAFQLDTVRHPSTEEGLQALVVQPPGVENWKGPYLKRALPKDPWGNPYIYRQPGKLNPKGFDLGSFGPNGTDGGGDDLTE